MVPTLSPLTRGTDNDKHTFSFFFFFQFSLEALSPQLLSKEDTFPGVRGKRRAFSPGAATRHSQSARAYTDSRKTPFFSQIFGLSQSENDNPKKKG